MKKKRAIYVAIILMLAAAALCGFFFVSEYMTAQEEIAEYTAVQDEYTRVVHATDSNPGSGPAGDTDSSETAGLPYVEADFDALLQINSDTVGWVAIPDSVISYPVVQGKDNVRYLNISFEGRRSGTGTPFADKSNNMRALDANTILYGHNMGGGRQDMFGSLLSYKDHEYFSTHRYIQFDTIYQRHGWWKVFAVVEYDMRSNKFDYLQLRFSDDDGFMEWIAKVKELSLYEDDVEISPDARVLTLSTCDRSKFGRNGRILILAVKVE